MLFGEPGRTQADVNFSLFGFPVRVHPLFWVVAVLLGSNMPDARALVLWVVAVFVGVLVHELGHAVVMRWNGFQPSITLYGLGGAASYGPGAYGMQSLSPWRQIGISAAGPGAGFLLAAMIYFGLELSGVGTRISFGLPFGVNIMPASAVGGELLTLFVILLLFVTVAYGVLNLMPIYPLDGGQIARELFLMAMPRDGIRHSLILSMLVGGAIAVLGIMQGNFFLALLFGYMAFGSYNTLQHYQGRGSW